ncbi:MAG: flagellar hook capping FlgD N-terminal domain-containing protein [Burkholderiales bacterium]|nr:flagellar hook assembly protein FlgD [Burkholderiales bacterium]
MTTSVTATSPITTSSTSTSKTALSDANVSQDRFLKLLVAQLNNQDPMNPMDNAQMTSQMAQINTVSGIQQVNETLKTIGSQFTAMQLLQGTGMIGHDVLLQSNTLSVSAGKAAGAIDLAGNADKVTVQVLSPAGQVIDTLDLGAMTAGRHSFEWDASSYQGSGSPTFKVSASSGANAVSTTSLARDAIVSVGSDGTAMTLQLRGRDAVAYDAVKAIL